jgi:hypothetical protein
MSLFIMQTKKEIYQDFFVCVLVLCTQVNMMFVMLL